MRELVQTYHYKCDGKIFSEDEGNYKYCGRVLVVSGTEHTIPLQFGESDWTSQIEVHGIVRHYCPRIDHE